MKRRKDFYFVIVILGFVLMACSQEVNHHGKTPLAQVDGEFLYVEDVQKALPMTISKADSAQFVDRYIRNWAEDVLLYHKAEGNVPDNDKIEELVSSYRKTLIMHTYQEELVNQEIGENIKESEIEKYYEQNSTMFLAVQPYIKGLFLKVPLNAPHLNNVRVWYRSNSQMSIDKLEKYTISNAVSYDYFYDDWKPVTDLSQKIPLKALGSDYDYLMKNRNIEVSDTAFHYFLHVESFLPQGDVLPIEYAKDEIKDILVNLKRVDYINMVKKDLYNEANDNKKIIYY